MHAWIDHAMGHKANMMQESGGVGLSTCEMHFVFERFYGSGRY